MKAARARSWDRLTGEVRVSWSGLLDLVYPRQCAGCSGHVIEAGRHLCWECTSELPFIHAPYCARCGDPIEGAVDYEVTCAFCARRKVGFTRARSAVRYRGRMRSALQAFKYNHAVQLAGDFELLLTACIRAHFDSVGFDAVTSVPLHRKKERARSYNQSALLARHVGRALGLPVHRQALVRVRDTETQTHLSASSRRRNVRGAFEAGQSSWTDGRCYLLIDDVMTTGATVDECARVLNKAGAVGVYVATVARG